MNRVRMLLLLACVHAVFILLFSVLVAGAVLVCWYGYFDAEAKRMWGRDDES